MNKLRPDSGLRFLILCLLTRQLLPAALCPEPSHRYVEERDIVRERDRERERERESARARARARDDSASAHHPASHTLQTHIAAPGSPRTVEHEPLSSEYGTHQTFKAGFGPWLSG